MNDFSSSSWSAQTTFGKRTYPEVLPIPIDIKLAKARYWPSVEAKHRSLVVSAAVASAICIVSATLSALEFAAVVTVAHPLFWLPIAIGSLGVAGSAMIYLRRLPLKPRAPALMVPQIFLAGEVTVWPSTTPTRVDL